MNESLPIPANEGEPTDEPLVMAALTAALAEPENPPDTPQVAEAGAAAHEGAAAEIEPAIETPAPEVEHAGIAPLALPVDIAIAAPEHPIEAPPTAPTSAPANEEQLPPALAELPAASAPVSEEEQRPLAVAEAPSAPPPPGEAKPPAAAAAEPPVSPAQAALAAAMPNEPAPVERGVGVLLVNLGTPDAPDPKSVQRYLKEFLTDRRVIEKDSLIWKMVLHGIILPLRSRRRARDYQKIWNREKNESPIKVISRSQAEKLSGILEPLGKHIIVDWAMRYANPSIASRLEAMIKRGCDRILIMPLYPQYSGATTATVCDEVYKYMMGLRRQPALRILPPYYEDAYYIEVVASSLKAELKGLSFEPDVILASYHGMPKEYVAKGDPYESQCVRTTQLLREQLGFDDQKLMMSFQSRFGRGKWLEPYTIKTVKALAKKGVKNLVVVTPGFAADCLETLEEIAVENGRMFKRHGGKNFAVIPCLNDSEAGMLLIWQLAMRELKGWA
jgi:protoporphyrin/coproporphyrin ferrochelatase